MNNDTPTPRTDAAINATIGDRGVYEELERMTALARELERENARLAEILTAPRMLRHHTNQHIERLRNEAARIRRLANQVDYVAALIEAEGPTINPQRDQAL